MRAGIAAAGIVALVVLTVGCSTKERLLGEQCPSPYAGGPRTDDTGAPQVYGTSCAPCDVSEVRFDARGCPMYVTFDSCGGPVCIGGFQLTPVGDEDAGTEDDAGAATEDDADAG